MSIRTRIFLACLGLTAVTLVFGVVSRSAQTQLAQIAVRLYDEAFMSMSYLRSAQNTLLTISRDVAAGKTNPAGIGDRLDDAVGDIGVAVERALSPKGKAAASSLEERLRAISEDYHASHRLPGRDTLADLETTFDRAVEINAGDGFRSRRAAKDLIQQISQQTWIAMAISLAVALVITFVLSRSIVRALTYAVGIATSIAAGRLDNRIDARGRSETSALLRALATMQRSIADKMAQIQGLMAEQASDHASEMASQHLRFETALDNMVQGLCMFDSEGRVLVHNRRFAEMFAAVEPGALAQDALPAELRLRAEARESWSQARSFTRILEDQRIIAVTEKPMEGGGWVVTFEDTTERHRVEERIFYMARHDPLTGLPNRILYQEHTDHALADVRPGTGLAVLYIDLDHFKAINDTLGHPVGDALLCSVAQRLRDETRATDMIIRLGGDEFAIIQSSATHEPEAAIFAERLIEVLGKPFQVGEHQLLVGASIGIAITDDERINGETLLKRAEIALYKAKDSGRNTFRFFEADMDEQMQVRRRLELDLRTAVAERQFENYYQPLVTVDTREVSGFEALVRWRHPERGIISPGEFIGIAEETGLIIAIGMQVLEQACQDALAWPDHIKVAVNLSSLQFRERNIVSEIAGVLDRSGFPATRLELELTESVLLQDSDATLKMLHELRALGIRISMDDFGTGYSSLSYLHRFPFDKIKIDQSFIRGLTNGADCIALVRAVLGLGKSLGMRVVAEGVETREQLSLLDREGCDQVQGYLFSKPVPARNVPQLLEHQEEFAA